MDKFVEYVTSYFEEDKSIFRFLKLLLILLFITIFSFLLFLIIYTLPITYIKSFQVISDKYLEIIWNVFPNLFLWVLFLTLIFITSWWKEVVKEENEDLIKESTSDKIWEKRENIINSFLNNEDWKTIDEILIELWKHWFSSNNKNWLRKILRKLENSWVISKDWNKYKLKSDN